MNQQEYERQEMARAGKRIREIESAPIAERKEAKSALIEACIMTPDIIVERVGWLLNGSYGHGEYLGAWSSVNDWKTNKRINIRARLFILISAYEWMCSPRHAAEVWNKLDIVIKNKINAGIDAEIESAIADHEA